MNKAKNNDTADKRKRDNFGFGIFESFLVFRVQVFFKCKDETMSTPNPVSAVLQNENGCRFLYYVLSPRTAGEEKDAIF